MTGIIFPPLTPSHEEIKLGGFGILNIFIIGYFFVVFDLVFQTFHVHTHFQRRGNFDVTV